MFVGFLWCSVEGLFVRVVCFVTERNEVSSSGDGIWFVVCSVGVFWNVCKGMFVDEILDVLMFGCGSQMCFPFIKTTKCDSNCC